MSAQLEDRLRDAFAATEVPPAPGSLAHTVERRVAFRRQARGMARVALGLLAVASLASLANAGLTDQRIDTVAPSPAGVVDDRTEPNSDPPLETPAPQPNPDDGVDRRDRAGQESAVSKLPQPANILFGWIIALLIPLGIGALVGTHPSFALSGPRVTERRIVAAGSAATLALMASLALSGVLLAIWYVPTVDEAWPGLLRYNHQVAADLFPWFTGLTGLAAVEPGTDISTYIDELRRLGFTGSTGTAQDLENILDGMSRRRDDTYDSDLVAVGPVVDGRVEVAAGVYDNDGAIFAYLGVVVMGLGLVVTMIRGLFAHVIRKRARTDPTRLEADVPSNR